MTRTADVVGQGVFGGGKNIRCRNLVECPLLGLYVCLWKEAVPYLKDAKSHVQLAGKLGSPFTLLCLLHHWEKELNMNQPFKLGL